MGGVLVNPSAELLSALRRDEELRLVAYDDATGKPWQPGEALLGKLTLGYGRNLSDLYPHYEAADWLSYPHLLVCTQDQAEQWLLEAATKACTELHDALPWTSTLDAPRLEVLQNMTYNMGLGGLLKFHNTLTHVQRGQFFIASQDMEESLWDKQTKERAARLVAQMRTGTRH